MKLIMENWKRWIIKEGTIDYQYFKNMASDEESKSELQKDIVLALRQETEDHKSLTPRQREIVDAVQFIGPRLRDLGYQTDVHKGAEYGIMSAAEKAKKLAGRNRSGQRHSDPYLPQARDWVDAKIDSIRSAIRENATLDEDAKIKKLEDQVIKAVLASGYAAPAYKELTKMSKMGKYDLAILKKKVEDAKTSMSESAIEEKKGKKDACYHKVKASAKVWPSAYASGRLVQCRKKGASNYGNKSKKKNENTNLKEMFTQGMRIGLLGDGKFVVISGSDEVLKIFDKREDAVDYIEKLKNKNSQFFDEKLDEKKRKLTSKPSSETSLRDWFGRKGAKGKKSGWVDCNTCRKDKKTGRKTCSACGRSTGEKRAKYPSCRPTPSACGKKGNYGKKSKSGRKG